MSRWEPEHRRGRLEQADLALCGKRGFGQTTVVEIAEPARLTERTFFCHFADQTRGCGSPGAAAATA
jgi:hypothetical protein